MSRESIFELANDLNFSHKELVDSGAGLISELSLLLKKADSEGLGFASEFIRESFKSKAKSLTGSLARPRFMNDARRTRMRLSKKSFVLSSKSFCRNMMLNWSCLPCDFSSYLAGEPEPIFSEIEKAAESFRRIGCHAIADSIKHSAPDPSDEFMGFKRLSIHRSAMILAKLHGYKPVRNGQECLVLHTKSLHEFKSVVFPLSSVMEFADPSLIRTVFNCDSEGAFDHYLVVSPVPNSSDTSISGVIGSIKAMKFNPIVLGEREGKCYFLGLLNRSLHES
jgi:hypothetical protein